MSDSSKPFDILGSFADPSNFDTGAAKLVNVRAVARQPTEGRPSKVRLVGTPGLTVVNRVENSPLLALGTTQQAQGGNGAVYGIFASGNFYGGLDNNVPGASIGAVDFTGATYPIVRLAELKQQLAIATNSQGFKGGSGGYGGKGWVYHLTDLSGPSYFTFMDPVTLTPGVPSFTPSSVCVLDNIAIWAASSDQFAGGTIQNFKMYSSAVGDARSVALTAFAAKEGRSDPLIDVSLTVRNFIAHGERSTEIWYDAGNGADFPFQPFTNVLIDVGLANRRTKASVHGKVMWLGTDNRIWLCYGQTAKEISPPWLDLELQRMANTGTLQQLTAFMYAQGGDEFYCLTREGFWSLEMALSTGIWNYVQSPGRPDSARRCAIEYSYGRTFIGLDTGHVCLLDNTTASEPAGTLNRAIISPWVGDQTSRHVIDAITVTSSLGPAAGQFQLDWSEDGFNTVHGVRQITFPAPGQSRAIARELGSSRRRQVRLQYSGAGAPFEFDELFGDISGGT